MALSRTTALLALSLTLPLDHFFFLLRRQRCRKICRRFCWCSGWRGSRSRVGGGDEGLHPGRARLTRLCPPEQPRPQTSPPPWIPEHQRENARGSRPRKTHPALEPAWAARAFWALDLTWGGILRSARSVSRIARRIATAGAGGRCGGGWWVDVCCAVQIRRSALRCPSTSTPAAVSRTAAPPPLLPSLPRPCRAVSSRWSRGVDAHFVEVWREEEKNRRPHSPHPPVARAEANPSSQFRQVALHVRNAANAGYPGGVAPWPTLLRMHLCAHAQLGRLGNMHGLDGNCGAQRACLDRCLGLHTGCRQTTNMDARLPGLPASPFVAQSEVPSSIHRRSAQKASSAGKRAHPQGP
jgi:hypothetical protein